MHRVVIYGPGGVGKTELCSLLDDVGVSAAFIDLEDGTKFLNVSRFDDPVPETFQDVRDLLHSESIWSGFQAVVVDSLTKLEEWAISHTLRTVPHEKGHFVDRIEGYGWGKGYTHSYETFLQILGDFDMHVRRGRHVVCTAHEHTAKVPNPSGEDWLRYEPRLQATDKGSIRHRVKEWADHLLFVGFDTVVNKDGKAQGSGTRTIYPMELPTWWAKSRTLSDPIPYDRNDASLWRKLFNKG